MRHLFLALLLVSLTGCTTWNSLFKKDNDTDDTAMNAPTDLEGPAYDPAASPTPMTQNTVLPRPTGTTPPATYSSTPDQPQAYGSAPGQPQAYQGSENPADYPPATAPMSPQQQARGGDAPTAYATPAPATYSPETSEQIALAATLNGLWVNSADGKEIVEFTPDHYTTFYDGEMLFQEPMIYHPQCPGDCNGGQAMEIACFTISGPAGQDCYGIIRLTPEVMELSMLGVSTETIVYRKQ